MTTPPPLPSPSLDGRGVGASVGVLLAVEEVVEDEAGLDLRMALAMSSADTRTVGNGCL